MTSSATAILLAAQGAASRGGSGAHSPRPAVLRASAKHRWLPTRFPGRGSGSGAVAGMGADGFTPAVITGESSPRLGGDVDEERPRSSGATPAAGFGDGGAEASLHLGFCFYCGRQAPPGLRPQSGALALGARAHGAQCSAASDAAAARALRQAGPAAALGRHRGNVKSFPTDRKPSQRGAENVTIEWRDRSR